MRTVLRTLDGKEKEYSRVEGWIEPGDYLPCFQCGICCQKWQPLVDEAEIALIAKNLNIPLSIFRCQYLQVYPVRPETYLLRKIGESCIFLKEEKGKTCLIHPFKPGVCRQWQASLSRPECKEGLKGLGADKSLLLPQQLCLSGEDFDDFSNALKGRSRATSRVNEDK